MELDVGVGGERRLQCESRAGRAAEQVAHHPVGVGGDLDAHAACGARPAGAVGSCQGGGELSDLLAGGVVVLAGAHLEAIAIAQRPRHQHPMDQHRRTPEDECRPGSRQGPEEGAQCRGRGRLERGRGMARDGQAGGEGAERERGAAV